MADAHDRWRAHDAAERVEAARKREIELLASFDAKWAEVDRQQALLSAGLMPPSPDHSIRVLVAWGVYIVLALQALGAVGLGPIRAGFGLMFVAFDTVAAVEQLGYSWLQLIVILGCAAGLILVCSLDAGGRVPDPRARIASPTITPEEYDAACMRWRDEAIPRNTARALATRQLDRDYSLARTLGVPLDDVWTGKVREPVRERGHRGITQRERRVIEAWRLTPDLPDALPS